jgi:predicted alpha/beta superfamily hydrolase
VTRPKFLAKQPHPLRSRIAQYESGKGLPVKKWIFALILTAAVSAFATFVVNDYLSHRPVFGKNVEVKKIHSNVLKDDREFLVHLPESYSREPNRRYPVIYVLDGSSEDIHTAASAALMARIGVMPEVLVVGIPNVSGEGRQRDYTPPGMRQDIDEAKSPEGKADRFLAFLKTELIPEIEKNYRTAGLRMLAGNSRGGLFVVYSLIADPTLFAARFAHSPALWRDEDALVLRLEKFLAAQPDLNGFLYLSLGGEENEKMTAAFKRTVSALEAHAPPSLKWKADFTPGANHGTNAEFATPLGFRFFFAEGNPRP